MPSPKDPIERAEWIANLKKAKRPPHTAETKAKISKGLLGKNKKPKPKGFGEKMRRIVQGRLLSDVVKDNLRIGNCDDSLGPSYFVSFRDLVLLAMYTYHLQYMRCSRKIKRVLKEKGITRSDMVLVLNFWKGHNILSLSEKYSVNEKEVTQRLKYFEKQFPYSFQSGISVPALHWMLGCSYDWSQPEDWKITQQF